MLELPKDQINGEKKRDKNSEVVQWYNGTMHCNGTMVQLKLQQNDSGNGPAGRQ